MKADSCDSSIRKSDFSHTSNMHLQKCVTGTWISHAGILTLPSSFKTTMNDVKYVLADNRKWRFAKSENLQNGTNMCNIKRLCLNPNDPHVSHLCLTVLRCLKCV